MAPLDEEKRACQLALEESDAEKGRLLYVALTRAKRKLYVPLFLEEGGASFKGKEASAMELFLAHLVSEKTSHEALYTTLSNLQPPQVFSLLHTLAPHVHVHMLGESTEMQTPLHSSPPPLTLFSPTREKTKLKPLLSFSSLAKSELTSPLSLPEGAPLSIHTLPPGAETGLFVHSLFEEIFKRGAHHPLNEKQICSLVHKAAERSGFAPWKEVLASWTLEVLKTPLVPGLSLCAIPSRELYCEMEFLYPSLPGLMKGFVDLLFVFEGKYYILDWKTNYLGPSDESYTEEAMQLAVHHHQYDLQASIYAEALRRYVKLFDNRPFSSCFGGAFYYFVRGRKALFLNPKPYE